jgi:signal transduction histidine kinase
MLVFETIRIAGWLVGTILHGLLLAVLIDGRRKRGTALAYSWLIGSALLWHLGNLLVAFLGELTGNKLPAFLDAARILATVGFGLLPSTLIHTAVVARIDLFKRPRLIIVLGYVPVLSLAPVAYGMVSMGSDAFLKAFQQSAPALGFVGAWFVAALAMTARIMSVSAKTPETEREHFRFRRAFGVGLFALAVALALAVAVEVITGGGRSYVAETLRVFVMLMSLLPGGLFFYHIYRYRYLDLTLRRGLSVAALVLAVFLAHGLLVKRITTALEEKYGVDFALLEGALVVGIVLLFEPARRRVQFALDAALAADRSWRRSQLTALQSEVALLPPGDLRLIVVRAREGLSNAFGTPVTVALRVPWSVASDDDDPEDDVACSPARPSSEITPLLNWAASEMAVPGDPVSIDSLPPGAGLVGDKLSLTDIIPIRDDTPSDRMRGSKRAVGFIGLGRRAKGQALGEEDVSSLGALASSLAVAARDADAVRRSVSLEHKLAEAEKLSSLGKLSATIAHEVKNPLSSIKTIVGVLRESGAGGPSADADLEVIAREVDRLSKVVTNLLNVARPAKKPGEGTAVAPSPEGFDAREMLEGLLSVLGPDARRRGLNVKTRFAPGTPRVWARESAVRQAVFQLILNAIEVTPAGGTVSVSAEAASATGAAKAGHELRGCVAIIVEDTGPGVPADKVDRIFEPFVSLKAGGTGLGLALAKEEIERAEGTIEADTRLDGRGGARFRVVLPAAARLAPI